MSAKIEHGISIGISRVDKFLFMKIKINGILKHEDYETMVPMLENALVGINQPQVKVLVDAREFDGWEFRAAWDDFKFGLEFKEVFTKIAFVGNRSWEEYGVKIGSWFMSTNMEFFKSLDDAYAWLNEEIQIQKTPIQKDLISRKESIENQLESLFLSNLKITDYNTPEPDNQDASEIIIKILEDKLQEIKSDTQNGKYK